jgi:ribosome-associated toxin RatA of RatAB toxin-antitoxin module
MAKIVISQSRPSPHRSEDLFALAADISGYPSFIKYIKEAKCVGEKLYSMRVGNSSISVEYTSKVVIDEANKRIEAFYHSGEMLKHVYNLWQFSDGQIKFIAEFELKNALLQMMAKSKLEDINRKIITAFEAEANKRFKLSTP